MKAINLVANTLNVNKHIANHVYGKDHTYRHRQRAGVIVMMMGVLIADLTPLLVHSLWLHIPANLVGYGLHGIGLTPFLQKYENVDDICTDCNKEQKAKTWKLYLKSQKS